MVNYISHIKLIIFIYRFKELNPVDPRSDCGGLLVIKRIKAE